MSIFPVIKWNLLIHSGIKICVQKLKPVVFIDLMLIRVRICRICILIFKHLDRSDMVLVKIDQLS